MPIRRRYSVVVASLIAITCAAPAVFADADLSWNRPPGFPEAESGLVFDCANSQAVHSLYVVFDVPESVPDLVALEFSIEAATEERVTSGAHVPFEPFWHFEIAGCNEGAIGASVELPGDVSGLENPWGPHGTLGLPSIASVIHHATDPGRMRVNVRIDRASPVSIAPASETFGGRLDWFLTCASLCGGCQQPVALALDEVRLIRQGGEIVHVMPAGLGCVAINGAGCGITGPLPEFVTGTRVQVPARVTAGACEPVPVRAPTWGSLKTLYR